MREQRRIEKPKHGLRSAAIGRGQMKNGQQMTDNEKLKSLTTEHTEYTE